MGLITLTIGTHKEPIVIVLYTLSTFMARLSWLHQSLIACLTIAIALYLTLNTFMAGFNIIITITTITPLFNNM